LNRFEKFLSDQKLPDDLLQQEGESLELWRDRLYHQFRLPVILAALNDLKLSYVEIVNPFLSRKIIHQVRKMPDHLRSSKVLYKNIISSISPKINIAKYRSLEYPKKILKSKEIIKFFESELHSEHVNYILPDELIDFLLKNLDSHDNSSIKKICQAIDNRIPTWMDNKIRNSFEQQKVDPNILTFRAIIVARMVKMLSEDAKSLVKVPVFT
jgi:hypothetical protein